MTRVLAAIVVPPHLSVSGGARAGEQLSRALAPYCEVTIANMMTSPAQVAAGGADTCNRVGVRTKLPFLLSSKRLPHHLKTLFYRSDIPDLVRRGGFDLVHIHNPMPALEMERVARACRTANIPYVVSTHGFNEVANGERIYGFDPLRRLAWRHLVREPVARVVRRADGIFMLSPADETIVREMGYRGTGLSVVSNGVPLPAPADPEADAAVCRQFGISPERDPGCITCMFLANHTPNKGLPLLLEAFSKLKCRFLLIIGGEKRSGIDYEDAIRSCRPGQRIVVTGRLDDDAVSPLMRRSDLFVFPTLADTLPLVVLEAMAHGLPVAASRVGGIPYQIGSDCGVLVPPGDAVRLAEVITDLGRDCERLARMGRAAQARVRSEFTWDGAAARAFHEYERALGGRRLSSRRATPAESLELSGEGSSHGSL